MNIDIATTVKVILVFIAIGLLASLYYALKSIKTGQHLEFFRKRQDLIAHGWRLILFAIVLGVGGLWIFRYGEPVAYRYFPPSPTMTRTPTVTLTPTITITPRETLTPTITETLAQTYTPGLPIEAQETIQTPIGPDSSASFSKIQFSTKTKGGVVTDTQTTFTAPVTNLFGGFSYDGMALGVQWTAVWYYQGKILFMETKAWKYVSGGYGYSDCELPYCELTAADWLPGDYEVQIFVGQTWKASGRFTIVGGTSTTETPAPVKVFSTLTPTLTPQATRAQ